jgi:hypothetical protein
MKMKNEELLNRCRSIDFSAESTSREKNLALLKSKIDKGEFEMKKIFKFKKSVALIAAAIAVLSLSVIALAAPAVVRHFEARIIQGEEYVSRFEIWESDDGEESLVVIEIDVNAEISIPIIAQMQDGEIVLYQARHPFSDLDEALSYYATEPLLPTYLPDGFAFRGASFTVCPVTNPENPFAATSSLIISYSDGQRDLQFIISSAITEWHKDEMSDERVTEVSGHFQSDGDDRVSVIISGSTVPNLDPPAETETEINGSTAQIGNGYLRLQIGDTNYAFASTELSMEELVRIAESLR